MKKAILLCCLMIGVILTASAQTSVFNNKALNTAEQSLGLEVSSDSADCECIWTSMASTENLTKVYIYRAASYEGHALGGGVLIDSCDYITANGATHYELKTIQGYGYIQFRLDTVATGTSDATLNLNVRRRP